MEKHKKKDDQCDKELQLHPMPSKPVTRYFAYGSNMLTARMMERVPSACVLKRAFLRDYKMVFNKKSADGSAKANLIRADGAVTWGVLYTISPDHLQTLDRYEKGYNRKMVTVETENGRSYDAWTYISENITGDMTAFTWYKEIIVKGAEEHNLPENYINYLKNLPTREDDR